MEQTPLGWVRLAGISYRKIEELEISEQAGWHGRCRLLLGMDETFGEQDVLRLEQQAVTVWAGECVIFCGVIVSCQLTSQAGEKRLELVLYSQSYLLDIAKKSRTFQSESKTLAEIAGQVAAPYKADILIQQDETIARLVYQEEQTDWEFLRRLAESTGRYIFADAKSQGLRISLGYIPFYQKQLAPDDKVLGQRLLLAEYGRVKQNTDKAAIPCYYTETSIDTPDLSLGVGYALKNGERDQIVMKSVIESREGLLVNHLEVINQEGCRVDAQDEQREQNRGRYLGGKILAVDGTNVKVHFDVDESQGEGEACWIPYENIVNNYMYSMPDVGDKVFVYQEENGKLMAQGSHRASTEGNSDYDTPENRSLTSTNNLLQFQPGSVILQAGRQGLNTSEIVMSDAAGISIHSNKDICFWADRDITVQAAQSKTPEQHGQPAADYEQGMADYTAHGGNNIPVDMGSDAEIGADVDGLKASSAAAEPVVASGQAKACDAATGTTHATAEPSPEEGESPASGIIQATGKDAVAMQVGASRIVIAKDGVIEIKAPVFEQSGYIKGAHEIAADHMDAEQMDQVAMDVGKELLWAGASMIPVVGNLMSIYDAYQDAKEGNWGMMALDLFCAIPGPGNMAKGLKAGAKGLKAAEKFGKVGKAAVKAGEGLIKAAEVMNKVDDAIKGILKSVEHVMTGAAGIVVGTGKIVGKAADDVMKGVKDAVKSLPDVEKLRGALEGSRVAKAAKTAWKGAKEGVGKVWNGGVKKIKKLMGDPVDLVTGSFVLDITDMVFKDLGEDFVLTRCYESLYENKGQHLGSRWLISVGMCLSRRGDHITVLMPDLHLEKFCRQQDGSWQNQRGGSLALQLAETKTGYQLSVLAARKCYTFDETGKLTSLQKNQQKPVVISYQGDFIDHITLACGQEIRFTYERDKISTIKDPTGRVLRYTYEGDLLTKVTYPNRGYFAYTYDDAGRILSVKDLNGKTYVENTYDSDSRVTRQAMITGGEYVYFYDPQNRQTTYTEVHTGQRLTVHYNRQKLVEAIDYPDGTTEQRGYDAWENQVYQKDRLGRETRWEYDVQGNLLQETSPTGLVTTHTYDEQGLRIHSEDNLGDEICYTYTQEGWLQEKKTKQAAGIWQREIYTYDREGRMLSKSVNDQVTQYWYEEQSPVPSAMKTPCGDEFRYHNDEAYRLSIITSEFGSRSFGYDSMDHIVSDTDALDNEYKAEYDKMGNLLWECSPKESLNGDSRCWQYTYDGMDNPIRTKSPLGVVFAKVYDGESRLVKEIHPEAWQKATKDGEGTTYDYDPEGRRIRTHYPDGGVERCFYDAVGNLIKKVTPNHYEAQTDDGAGIIYTYDAGNNRTSVTDADGNLIEVARYDAKGRCIYQQDAGQLAASREGMTYATTYRYDLAGNKLEERKAVAEKDGEIQYSLRRWRYDIHNNIVAEKTWLTMQSATSASGLARTIWREYDAQNRCLRVTDSLGAEVRYTYNSIGKRTSETRKISGEETQYIKYAYDAAGRLLERAEKRNPKRNRKWWATTSYTYDADSNIIEIQLPDGSKIQREYDIVDRMTAETIIDSASRQQNTTRFAYDKAGNLLTITDDCGREERFTYNLMNQQTQATTSAGRTQKLVYDKEGNITERQLPQEMSYHYQYDSAGRLTAVIGTDGKPLETVAYDRAGRRIKVDTAGGSGASYAYTAAGWQTHIETKGGASQSYHYDALGNITGIIDGNGNETTYLLDSWGRITEICKADGSKENYAYDFAGNITEAVDGNGNKRTYAYDDNNQLKCITYPDGSQEQYHYTADGKLIKFQDRNGITNEYQWNVYGSLVERKAGDLRNSYEYAPNGQLIAAIAGGMDYRYTYDKDGLLLTKKASGRTLLAYTYDELGRKTSQTDITGQQISYRFDKSNQLVDICDEFDQSIVKFTRDADGAIQKITHANGMWQDVAYDADKNITSLTVATPDKLLAQNTYRYDGNGQRIEKNELTGKTLYTYDSLNRLAQAEYPTYTERFSYDQAGNRLTRTAKDIEEQYIYDVNNRLTKRTVNGQVETYRYDNAGNLLQDGNNTYEYDDFRRTSKVTTKTGIMQINRYDAEDLRHEMEENGKLVQFIFNENKEAITEETDGNITRLIRTSDLWAMEANPEKTWYHYASDEQGSTVFITDEQGDVKNRYTYDAFGNTIESEEQIPNRYQYTGQQLDPITKQYYLRARFYNPAIARFTQEDEYHGDGLNLYAYCANDPVDYYDPSGYNDCPNKKALYQVGEYNKIKGKPGLDAHHVGQKAMMKKLVKNYDFKTAPAINVPIRGHTRRLGDKGIVSRKMKGINSARQLLARDIKELRRVYPDIPNQKLKELIELNKSKYPEMRK
ncbi:RHS repeat-associated core domain-containing protein [Selenomonas sp. GACV-9]|uniref:RHS repeat-associated core domain-containing protein n=1 Tax=Selenomonas sp. GACV-9 TaxID=3158782 RepID=UPI0008F33150|nr:RHS repeat-associated core domain-containing protein [Selenomonas ruminantium]